MFNAVKDTIQDITRRMELKNEIVEREDSITVFIKNDDICYCPYVFNLFFQEEGDSISLCCFWGISRMFAPGEKTDLYVLFANTMHIVLKVVFNSFAEVEYLGHPGCTEELGGANLFLCEQVRDICRHDFQNKVEYLFEKYIAAMQFHYFLFGSYGLHLEKMKINRECLFDGVKIDNVIAREDHIFCYNYENQISLLELSEEHYDFNKVIQSHKWEIIDGIDGKVIVQTEMNGKSYNVIPNQYWEYVNRIVEENKCENYTIICQENVLYVLYRNKLWAIQGAYYHYWVEQEAEKILEKQRKENELLLLNKSLRWKYPIEPSRFENLIADLLEKDPKVSRVRLTGKTNDSDGGRDILIYKFTYNNQKMTSEEYLVIGQCKAYKNSVNKTNVTDIRDMLDNYNAAGFLLAVASNVTVPLEDYLMKLGERYEVDWWTQREIFSKLKCNYYLLEQYKDIVEIL